MATYLFTWNPTKWDWSLLDDDVSQYKQQGFLDGRWSCGRTKKIKAGDRAFLMRLGSRPPRGILASGECMTEPFTAPHFSIEGKYSLYVNLRYDVLLHPYQENILSKDELRKEMPTVTWTPQESGITIPPVAAARLEDLWVEHLFSVGLSPVIIAEEIRAPDQFTEGAVRRISVEAYERDPRSRKACIDHYGSYCQICRFDFEKTYGAIGADFIHVHHLTPLSEIKETYKVDPIRDLIPVCPNCHAMIHRKKPLLTPEQLRTKIKS